MATEREKRGWVARGDNKMADDGECVQDTNCTRTVLEKGQEGKGGGCQRLNIHLFHSVNKTVAEIY